MITYDPIPGRIIDLIYAQMIRYDYSGCLRAANEQTLFVEGRHRMVCEGFQQAQMPQEPVLSVLFAVYKGDCCFNRFIQASKGLFHFSSISAFLDWIRRMEPGYFSARVLRILDGRCTPLAEYENRLHDSGKLLSLIRSFELEEKYQFYLLSLCLDGEHYLRELHQSFLQCAKLLEKLNLWTSGTSSLNTAENMDEKRLFRLLDMPVEGKKNIRYSICMLPDGLVRVFDKPEELEIIIGCNACSPLEATNPESPDLQLIGNALSEQRRLDILSVLRGRELYATEIANELHVSNNTLFYHMNMLCEAKLLAARTSGRKVFYSIDTQTLKKLSIYFDRLYRQVAREQQDKAALDSKEPQSDSSFAK